MQRLPVIATDIRAIGYDGPSERLEVEFRWGHVYEFYHVPAAKYALLLHSGGIDQYFHKYIRDRHEFLRTR